MVYMFIFCLSLPLSAQSYSQSGYASFYANKFEGKTTASGEIFSNEKMTAAHKELAFGTNVKVTNLENQKSVVVTITDRGPFIKGRIIDVSQKAAKKLGFYNQGITFVKIEVINKRVNKYPLHHIQHRKLEDFAIITIADEETHHLLKYKIPF